VCVFIEVMLCVYRLDREKKALQAKLAQQQHENEMEEWRESIMTTREIVSIHLSYTDYPSVFTSSTFEENSTKARLTMNILFLAFIT